MVQVYLLLVVLNAVSGLVLARAGLKVALPVWDGVFAAFESKVVRGILGAETFLTGFVGLIFVLPGDQLFVGDLFPSVSALLAGTTLMLDFYAPSERSAIEPNPDESGNAEPTRPRPIDDLLVKNRVLVGFVALTFALVHFLVPGIILL